MNPETIQTDLDFDPATALHSAGDRIRKVLASVSLVPSREAFLATIAAMRGLQLKNGNAACVTRNLAYGSDTRHRFDWFEPAGGPRQAGLIEVVVFVHGGGFVGGNKQEPDSPLYDNIGIWAAAHGLYAATINYRLAPQHRWPSGAEDVQLAIKAIAAHASDDADSSVRIFAMGHSAGAAHVAGAITRHVLPAELAGAVLISGLYDNTLGKPNAAYYGDRPETYVSQSTLAGLSALRLPLFVAVAEHDPPSMQAQAAALIQARAQSGLALPQFAVLDNNNHYSPVLLPNSTADPLGPRLLEFFSRGDRSQPSFSSTQET